MSVQTAVSVLLAALVLIPGVLSQTWGVTYNPGSICALQGSTVVMGCTYSYPRDNSVKQTFWMDKDESNNPIDLSAVPQYVNRTEYLGNKVNNCTLRLRNLTTSDSTTYWFRFITNTTVGKWTGKPGVSLSVTGLQVQVNSSTVTEGQAVTLTCMTSCNLSDPSFTWYRNGLLLPAQTPSSPLTFNPVSYEHDGSYSCTARGYDNLPSPAVTLSVRYAPKNTSVSISPSGAISEGSSVTLTCSSSANPPVKNYTWFKINGTGPLYKGPNYTIINISSADSGQYYCEAQNEIGSNRSAAVTVNVLYAPKSTSVSISPSGEIAEGSSVTLTCSSSANPPVKNYTWFKINGTGPLYKGANYNIINISSADSGQYYCEAQNKIGSNRSAAGTVDVLSKSSLSQVPALAGAFAVVMVVGAAVAVICIWRRKKRLPAEEGVMTDGRQGCSRAPGHQTAEEENMYSNIEGLPVTGREQARGTAVQQSEVSYATVQFRPRTAQEPEGRDLTAGDLVIYSSVTQGSIS